MIVFRPRCLSQQKVYVFFGCHMYFEESARPAVTFPAVMADFLPDSPRGHSAPSPTEFHVLSSYGQWTGEVRGVGTQFCKKRLPCARQLWTLEGEMGGVERVWTQLPSPQRLPRARQLWVMDVGRGGPFEARHSQTMHFRGRYLCVCVGGFPVGLTLATETSLLVLDTGWGEMWGGGSLLGTDTEPVTEGTFWGMVWSFVAFSTDRNWKCRADLTPLRRKT